MCQGQAQSKLVSEMCQTGCTEMCHKYKCSPRVMLSLTLFHFVTLRGIIFENLGGGPLLILVCKMEGAVEELSL